MFSRRRHAVAERYDIEWDSVQRYVGPANVGTAACHCLPAPPHRASISKQNLFPMQHPGKTYIYTHNYQGTARSTLPVLGHGTGRSASGWAVGIKRAARAAGPATTRRRATSFYAFKTSSAIALISATSRASDRPTAPRPAAPSSRRATCS